MKQKLQLFTQMLYNNDALLKTARAGVLVTALVLFINVSLISAPNYIGYMEGVRSIDNLHSVETSFEAMYEDEVPCYVDQDETMQCDLDEARTYGTYVLRYQESVDVTSIDETSIIFTPDKAAIIYHEDERAVVEGNYSLLKGFDFPDIKDKAEGQEDPDSFYANNTDYFLRNLYYSDVNETIGMVYTIQFAQLFLYVFFVSLMFMMLNFRASIKKITYQASLRITIFAMTGPALITALLGLRISSWSYLIFTLIYLTRVTVMYYKLHRSKVTVGLDTIEPPQ